MRVASLPLVLLVLSTALPARAEEDLADVEDEELIEEGLFFGSLDPLDLRRSSLGVSLRGAVGWWQMPLGRAVRWEAEIIVHFPLDRLFGLGTNEPLFSRQNGGSMKTKRHARWGTLAASLAIGGIASAKEKAPLVVTKAATTTAASDSASAVASASTSASVSPPAPASGSESTNAVRLSPTALRALVTAAWRASGLTDDTSLDDLAARAKSSALAPEVRLRAHRTNAVGARIFSVDTLADHSTLSDGTQTFLEARLTWQLDRLVFADEEVAIERMRIERAELRQRVAARVVELALAWLRARRAATNPDLLPEEREEATMRALEAFLALDATTAGAATELLRVTAGSGP